MVVEHTVRDTRARDYGSGKRDRSTLCRHCEYNPASDRIFGFCSWDCHDADDGGGDAEGDRAA